MLRFRFALLLGSALAAGLVGTVAAIAGTPVTYTDEGRALFRFEAPDFWTLRTGGTRQLAPPGSDALREVERVIGLQPTAEAKVWVGFISPRGVADFAGARAYLKEIGPFLVKSPETDAVRVLRIGGLPAQSFSGRGTRNGREVGFVATVIDLPGGRLAVSVAVIEPGAGEGAVDEVNAIYRSFRAVR